ncbi:hypothetical protein [Flavobacterium johnsoniae]|uniref:hypothetical protein n=1 Tax=Flavobacterium johnsoniae TaxID=986 RepID=UPI003D992D1C
MPFPDFIAALFGAEETVNENTFEQNQALLTRFLQAQENTIIRIYVTASPGYGHQANTVNIMYSLITAGFNQNIQMIYDDAPTEPPTINKLATFIPGLDPNNPQPVVINANTTVSFISTTAFNANQQPLRTFGITGGYDNSADNLALKTNTSIFLKLQPYCWIPANALYINRGNPAEQVVIDLGQVDVLGNYIFTRQNYYLPLPQMSEADYLQFTNAAPTKVDPYNAILTANTAKKINMMPVYGIGDINGTIESLGSAPESVLFNLIASVAYTQEYSDVPYLKKGAVIVVIANVTQPCYDRLTALLDGLNGEVPKLNEYILNQDLKNRVDIINYDDPNFSQKLTQTGVSTDKILVIKMGGIPGPAFNYMYSKSTLPCVFEGKGTASLVLNLPVPYFNLTSANINRRYVYPTLPLQNIKLLQPETAASIEAKTCNTAVFKLKENFVTTNTNMIKGGVDDTALFSAGQLIWKAYSDMDPINIYLASLPNYFHTLQNDKLMNALLYMLIYTNAN